MAHKEVTFLLKRNGDVWIRANGIDSRVESKLGRDIIATLRRSDIHVIDERGGVWNG
jgi:hypothetical protein